MSEPRPISFDAPLGQRIIELHVWAVREGLLGTAAAELFDGFCQQLVVGDLPLWRASATMRTLHPQWGGYSYLWRRDLNAIEPSQFERGENRQVWLTSPFAYLVAQAEAGGGNHLPWLHLRRRLSGPEALLDFPVLEELAGAGGTDYFAQIVRFGPEGDASRGTGIAYSFTTDCREGFSEDDLTLLRAVLPALSLAMMTHAGHTIASGLLAAYLGGDAGRRVHAGAVERGSVESMRAVLWFADMRGFTKLADSTPGREVIELLDDVFETLTAPLRSRGGQVLKFMGDGMLAIFPLAETQAETCRNAIDAASEAMHALDRVNRARAEASKPVVEVDLALHMGEVLYGNVGAADRLDFTVIGPAVNEAARIETLCEPLGRKVLVSAEFAAAAGSCNGLHPLGHHRLRGVRELRAIYGLDV
ncbi:MAG: adenylate/guanylate cyclase domain-containing protein [Alphaproteobacteria bacterium]|nr:adenylate/guanylate cyclase domain-containing protein [Alphaproteobacteria bacterium]